MVNSTELARLCGAFSKFWRHIDTPLFLTTTQLDPEFFQRTTCGVSRTRNEDYSEFAISWRQGMLVMAEAMSEEKPGNGWFIPNCDDLHFLFGADNAAARRAVRVPLLQEGDERVNAFQVRTRHGRSASKIPSLSSPFSRQLAVFNSQYSTRVLSTYFSTRRQLTTG